MFELSSRSRILITGGTGFVGTHLVQKLVAQGYQNIHVTSFGNASTAVAELLPEQQIHQLNLTDAEGVKQLWQTVKPEAIFHLASLSSVMSSFDQVSEVITNNTQLQISLLEAMKALTPKARFLAITSAEVYGKTKPEQQPLTEQHPLQPVNPYAVSKATQDMLAYMYVDTAGLDIIRVRPFNHTGAGQAPQFVVSSFAKQVAEIEAGKRDKLQVGNLEARRDFSDVEDIVAAYEAIMKHGLKGEVYNVGKGEAVSIQSILDELIRLATKPIEVEQVADRMRPSDAPIMVADISKVKALGWEPKIPTLITVKKVLDYWRTQV